MADTTAATLAANFIGGQWSPSYSGRTYERHNPWRPSEAVGEFPSSNAEDVAAAVDAAERAWPAWAAMSAVERGAVLGRAADRIIDRVEEIAQVMTREMGNPLRESRIETSRAAAVLRYFSGEGWRPQGHLFEQSATRDIVYTRRRALGVVGLITPWNFPIAIPTWKSAPALAYGNRQARSAGARRTQSADRRRGCEAPTPPSSGARLRRTGSLINRLAGQLGACPVNSITCWNVERLVQPIV